MPGRSSLEENHELAKQVKEVMERAEFEQSMKELKRKGQVFPQKNEFLKKVVPDYDEKAVMSKMEKEGELDPESAYEKMKGKPVYTKDNLRESLHTFFGAAHEENKLAQIKKEEAAELEREKTTQEKIEQIIASGYEPEFDAYGDPL